MNHLNIEIKAKCSNHAKILELLKSLKADFKGTDRQTDTYFKVNTGRLKLREGNIENFLIYYERENKAGPKKSSIILFKSSPESSLKPILVKSCGVLVVVDKKREIYFIENVKFHIDTVKKLSTFVEIEAIDKNGSIGKKKLLEQCNKYLKLFGISKADLISVSYSDLLLEKSKMAKPKAIIFDWGRTLFDSESKKEFEESEKVLSYCANKGIILAVASLVSEHSIVNLAGRRKQIKDSPLRKYFSFTLVTDKDKDAVLDEIVSKLGFKREEIMIVDDRTIRGIKYGNLRNHPTVWLQKDKFANELPNEETKSPTYTIRSLEELTDII